MYKPALIAGALLAALSVVLGAFGAHALKEVLTEAQLQTFETGVRYQMYHSIALLVTGTAAAYMTMQRVKLTTIFFLIGIILFSGSLYLLTLMKLNGQIGIGGLGLLTPIGGLFFIVGWLMFALGVVQKK